MNQTGERAEGAILALALDAHAGAHLLAALRSHRRWCRDQGYAFPDALAMLENTALNAFPSRSDSERQPATVAGVSAEPRPTVEAMTATITECATALGVSTRTVQRLVARGEIASTKVGGSRRIPRSELDRLTGGEFNSATKEAA